MLVQHRRRWTNIKPALIKHRAFVEIESPQYLDLTGPWRGVICWLVLAFPARNNTKRWTNAGWMLNQYRRLWSNIGPALLQRLVVSGVLCLHENGNPIYLPNKDMHLLWDDNGLNIPSCIRLAMFQLWSNVFDVSGFVILLLTYPRLRGKKLKTSMFQSRLIGLDDHVNGTTSLSLIPGQKLKPPVVVGGMGHKALFSLYLKVIAVLELNIEFALLFCPRTLRGTVYELSIMQSGNNATLQAERQCPAIQARIIFQ